MDISKFLAKVTGIYLIIISLLMLIDMNRMLSLINSFINNPPLVFVTGIFTLILGILLVVSHNIWHWDWRLIITLIAWIVLLKGISAVAFPQVIDNVTLAFIKNASFYYTGAGLDLLLGIILSYFGYKR